MIAGVFAVAFLPVLKFRFLRQAKEMSEVAVVVNSKTSSKKALLGGGIAVIAIALFWVGGFYGFVRSDDYHDIQQLLRDHKPLTEQIGAINRINPKFWGFSNSLRGNESGSADLYMHIEGTRSSSTIRVIARKRDGRWSIERVN